MDEFSKKFMKAVSTLLTDDLDERIASLKSEIDRLQAIRDDLTTAEEVPEAEEVSPVKEDEPVQGVPETTNDQSV